MSRACVIEHMAAQPILYRGFAKKVAEAFGVVAYDAALEGTGSTMPRQGWLLVLEPSQAHGDKPMHIVHLDSTDIQGIEVTTTNEYELNSGTPRIAALWGTFFEAHYGQTLYGTPIYAVYTRYESDVNGQYTVILGVKSNGGEANQDYTKTTIQAGKYLVFTPKEETPEASAWQDVWRYFANEESEYQRAYTTDFVLAESLHKQSLYIAVK